VPTTDPAEARPPPPTLLAGAVAVLVEGLVVLAGALYLGVESATADPDDPTAAWLGAGLALAAAAGLLAVGAGLLRRRGWARAPALVTQILLLPVGLPLLQGGQYAAGVPLTLLAVAGAVLLLLPATGSALRR
jgi:hypothetical protein